MIWSTPSSRKAHVVARSAVAAGMGTGLRDMVAVMVVVVRRIRVNGVPAIRSIARMIEQTNPYMISPLLVAAPGTINCPTSSLTYLRSLYLNARVNASNTSPQINPCSPIDVLAGLEPCVSDHPGKLCLWREFSNRLYQVLIRVSVSGEYRSKKRNDRKRVLVIQTRDVRMLSICYKS